MKCLQCEKEATYTGIIAGYEIRECEDGHRTGWIEEAKEKVA